VQFSHIGGKSVMKNSLRWLQPGIALAMFLASASQRPSVSVFPVRVTVKLPSHSLDESTQVLLERDQMKVWEQYLDVQKPTPGGIVTFRIQQPGVYWLLASSQSSDHRRRGACLLQVTSGGKFALTRLPRTKQGRRWGGAESRLCESGTIPLLPVRH